MEKISWQDFEKVEMRVGTIIEVKDFPKARKPAFQIWADFGEAIGIKRTSAQVTKLYSKEALLGRQIVGVVNFPPKQVADFISEFLILGSVDAEGTVTLLDIERKVDNGLRIA
jgi:tRNA-binding protein